MTRALLLAALAAPAAALAFEVPPATTPRPAAAPAATAERREPVLPAFGRAVAISGDLAFVAEPIGAGPGSVHVYRRGPKGWTQVTTLRRDGADQPDGFGTALATDGTTLLVGQVDFPTRADSGSGTVHVYRIAAGGAVTKAGTWRSPAPVRRGGFGSVLTLAGDLALVAEPGREAGVVHAFRRGRDGGWAPAGTLTPDGGASGSGFGSAIAVGTTRVAVGAPNADAGKGTVHLYARRTDGTLAPDGTLTAPAPAEGAMFGASVAFAGERLVVGAPGANKVGTNRRAPGVGTVTVFAWSAISEVWKERGTAQPFVHEAGMFGAAVEAVGDELWVAAPMADRGTGQLYRVGLDRDGRVTAVSAVAVGDVEPGSRLGTAFAVRGARAVVGLPGDGGGEGTALFLARNARGEWTRDGVVYPASDAKTFAAVTGKERLCEGGTVGEFECGGSSLLSFLPISAIGGGRGTRLNDNWGWTDPVTRREIAIVGRTDGTSFIDVTDPANPRYLGNLPKTKGQPSAAWRDIKVYKDHAFIVADASGEHGMQVFDLTRLRAVKAPQTFEPDVTYDRINSAHNIVSNEQTGFMYIVGGSGGGETCGGGYHMVDVREPKRPKFVGCFGDPKTGRAGTGYSHDAQCVVYHGPDARYTGKEICIGSNETAISIADLSDKANPVAISRASYPNVAYAHQAWLTDDHRYLYLNDEGDESAGKGEAAKGTRTLVWDLADLTDPVLVKEHVGVKKAIDHNLYVKGNRMYQANYTSGLRILDITDPRNPSEVGYFDTHPGDEDKPEFAGAWSVYPYFRSGTIVVTSIGEGVFFVKDRSQQPVVP